MNQTDMAPTPAETASEYRMVARVWVERGTQTYLGLGRIRLLEQILATGSIAAAARNLHMGYRHAWRLVEQMNSLAPVPLVRRSTGGRGGGGTEVTTAGEDAIAQYHAALATLERVLSTLIPAGADLTPREAPDAE